MKAPATEIGFPMLLQQFFLERLIQQRNASAQTVAAYRDSFRLLLQFAQRRLGKRTRVRIGGLVVVLHRTPRLALEAPLRHPHPASLPRRRGCMSRTKGRHDRASKHIDGGCDDFGWACSIRSRRRASHQRHRTPPSVEGPRWLACRASGVARLRRPIQSPRRMHPSASRPIR